MKYKYKKYSGISENIQFVNTSDLSGHFTNL